MVEITVQSNIKEFISELNAVQRNQLPFATSRALNDVAVDAQDAVINAIPHIFQNRKKWWLKRQPLGIKVKFSKKHDLKSSIYTKAYFAEIQEKGGLKTPKSSKQLAVPTDRVSRKYRTSHGAREMLAERQNVFKTNKGIFQRTGKKGAVLLWSYARSAKIKPRFGFYDICHKVIMRRFEQHFKKRLEQALSTARK
jgi:hypothetical protein